jgi:hypothetical protein
LHALLSGRECAGKNYVTVSIIGQDSDGRRSCWFIARTRAQNTGSWFCRVHRAGARTVCLAPAQQQPSAFRYGCQQRSQHVWVFDSATFDVHLGNTACRLTCIYNHLRAIAGAQHRPIVEFAIDDVRKVLKRRQRLSRSNAGTASVPVAGSQGSKSYVPAKQSATGQRPTRTGGKPPGTTLAVRPKRQRLGIKRPVGKKNSTQASRPSLRK